MADVVSSEIRSKMMAGIRGKNTTPELIVRKLLFAKGYRYRIHEPKLPGKPDIVLKRYSAVIDIRGCFWHGHSCRYFKLPSTRTDFWLHKIEENKNRDRNNLEKLFSGGWRVLIVWECALKNKSIVENNTLVDKISDWVGSKSCFAEFTQ